MLHICISVFMRAKIISTTNLLGINFTEIKFFIVFLNYKIIKLVIIHVLYVPNHIKDRCIFKNNVLIRKCL